ncbi:MAG: DegT/DnrJ/EryC1/StrS family aminotransferase [Eubacteriales bacterium]|nr:DegT/DnrJ/EryC1/StrS family aminotransferase [Eubacteriales bacterium]
MLKNKKIKPLEKHVYLSSPTMHGDELKNMEEAYYSNWMSTIGRNIDEVERELGEYLEGQHAVALSSGTAALHMAVRLAGIAAYGMPNNCRGVLDGRYVFCSDMTFSATVNPVVYEGGIPIFIDTEYDTWNMDPVALEKAFSLYPQVKIVMVAHLYGVPAKMDEIKQICDRHGAIIIEDAAEALGAELKGRKLGSFGDYNCISFNGNKIITGSSGGMLLSESMEAVKKVKKWSTQSREAADWYQHEEVGYNYRISNVVAGVVRGQLNYLAEHIAQKKEIYERYKQGLKGLPVSMNPFDEENAIPNYWLSCMIIDKEAMCKQTRSDHAAAYVAEEGKSCPTEILEALAKANADGRPIWKPMHMQPIFRMNHFINREGNCRGLSDAYYRSATLGKDGLAIDIGEDIFERGLCLPSDIKMTKEEQEQIIEIIRACFE